MTLFYDHLIDIEPVRHRLGQYLQPAEVEEVLIVLDGAHHHAVMETVLHALPLSAHDDFLRRFSADPSSMELLDMLRAQAPLIEGAIRAAIEDSNRKFLDGIHS
jgi:hypothetical protein